jgi:hypothetical protein
MSEMGIYRQCESATDETQCPTRLRCFSLSRTKLRQNRMDGRTLLIVQLIANNFGGTGPERSEVRASRVEHRVQLKMLSFRGCFLKPM